MDKLRYGIIYAVIRSEISEQISLGLVIVNGDEVKIRYSEKKLRVLKELYSKKEYDFISKVVRSMAGNENLKSINAINYLSRYSNNLITVSQLQTIDVPPTVRNENWLYNNYVYSNSRSKEIV